jgi:hypothetical protein
MNGGTLGTSLYAWIGSDFFKKKVKSIGLFFLFSRVHRSGLFSLSPIPEPEQRKPMDAYKRLLSDRPTLASNSLLVHPF